VIPSTISQKIKKNEKNVFLRTTSSQIIKRNYTVKKNKIMCSVRSTISQKINKNKSYACMHV